MNETEFQEVLIGTYSVKQRGFSGGLLQLFGWEIQHVEKVTMKGHGGRMLVKTPGSRGWPDITAVRDGQLAFLEVKDDKSGQVDDDQIRWLCKLADLPGRYRDVEAWRSRDSIPSGFVLCEPPFADGALWQTLVENDISDPDVFRPFWHRLVAVVRPRHLGWVKTALR